MAIGLCAFWLSDVPTRIRAAEQTQGKKVKAHKKARPKSDTFTVEDLVPKDKLGAVTEPVLAQAEAPEPATLGPNPTQSGPPVTSHGKTKAKPQPAKQGKPAQLADDFFTNSYLPHLQIDIPDEGMESLRQHPRVYVRGTIHEGDIVYTNVAIRLKGGPGSFRDINQKPAFTVNFAKFNEDPQPNQRVTAKGKSSKPEEREGPAVRRSPKTRRSPRAANGFTA